MATSNDADRASSPSSSGAEPPRKPRRWLPRILIALGVVAGLLVVAVGSALAYVSLKWDRTYSAATPEVHVSTSPDVIARGEYLVYGPAHCVECHVGSWEEFQRAGQGERVPLRGGFGLALGPLGRVYSANLTTDTATGIGRYSDGQIARMMRWAVRPNGQGTVEPMMPFGNMSQEDLDAIVSYLRTRPAVHNTVPANQWTMFGKVVRTFAGPFKPRSTINPPAVSPPVGVNKERGEYLARYVSNCVGCHTSRDPNTFAATGPDFSGGMEFDPAPAPGVDPKIWFRTPNITPAANSALTKFPNRDAFVLRFQKGGRQYAGSPMPWEAFKNMTADDIGSIYEFLRGLPASPGPTGDPTFRKAD